MKQWIYLGTFAAAFIAGAGAAGLYYRAEIADLKADYAQAAQKHQADLRKIGEENAEKLAQAADERQKEVDRLNLSLSAMRSDVERLRVANARRSGVPKSGPSAGNVSQRQDGDCLRLLEEGAGLLEEGGGLLRDFNADREAMRKLK